ncbi:hypothetical protein [Paenibacillus taihuensis]|uniref:hypothetical protein n=1 Tax=Paenibacillus taihuensis TaxID=1156355 RepID=UPI001FE7412F|nr:hypothetical protein [Paenibacillus taihuensis]
MDQGPADRCAGEGNRDRDKNGVLQSGEKLGEDIVSVFIGTEGVILRRRGRRNDQLAAVGTYLCGLVQVVRRDVFAE